jgi:hypothetical protein
VSPSLADNPLFILAILAGVAFFAAVHVSLGYWVGIQKAVAEARQEDFDRELYNIKTSTQEAELR